MADIFTAVRGTVVKSSDSAMGLAGLSIGDSSLLIITSVAIQRNQVTQYVKTLDSSTFGYAWGEGPGRIIIGGIIFLVPSGSCSSVTGDGISAVNSFYSENNVYVKSGPVALSLGNSTFLGYLEVMNIAAEMNEYNFANFSLELAIINGGA